MVFRLFGNVPHDRLLWKVLSQVIQGELTDWIEMWVDICFTDCRPVTSGLPQGLLLAPLLFVVDIKYVDENTRHDYQMLQRGLHLLG